ncbi:efflux RND transporter periplasmic adaptor subunit [Paraferrimonas haliotis]|uniref:efflux RND transporter periplasmic adaptor subunit n=1 Tax=Paraferrimonas haliotis TaxID=2013866 RepID=UPI0015C7B151|nr:efflux RND transporter periplasmic adaptor subunit [Paraferrimonas haliotis]
MKPTYLILISTLSAALLGCGQSQSQTLADPSSKPIKLTQVQFNSSTPYQQLVAEVTTTTPTPLSFRVGGELQSIIVEMGQTVEKGQLLAQLDPTDFELNLEATRIQRDQAKASFARAQQLFTQQLVSKDAFDQAESAYQQAQAAVEQAQTDLSYSKIYAPFSGVITLRHASTHQVLGPYQPLFTLVDNHHQQISSWVPVTIASRLRGQQPELAFVSDTQPKHPMPAHVVKVASEPDVDTNSYQVTLAIDTELALKPGHSGELQIYWNDSATQASLIPNGAWISVEQDNAEQHGEVWLFDSQTQTISRRQVSLDTVTNTVTGLQNGDWIVSSGVQQLSEGQKVRPWTRERGI